MRLLAIRKEKLRSVGIRATVGHAKDSACRVLAKVSVSTGHRNVRMHLQLVMDFVGKLLAPDALSALACA